MGLAELRRAGGNVKGLCGHLWWHFPSKKKEIFALLFLMGGCAELSKGREEAAVRLTGTRFLLVQYKFLWILVEKHGDFGLYPDHMSSIKKPINFS